MISSSRNEYDNKCFHFTEREDNRSPVHVDYYLPSEENKRFTHYVHMLLFIVPFKSKSLVAHRSFPRTLGLVKFRKQKLSVDIFVDSSYSEFRCVILKIMEVIILVSISRALT